MIRRKEINMRRSNSNNAAAFLLPYALCTFGLQAVIGFTASFQTEFYNKAFAAIDSRIITRCAIILAAAKLISCLLDPVIGMQMDRSAGKGRSLFFWLRGSVAPLAILTVLLFIRLPFERFGGKPLMYAYITFSAVLWNIAMSCTEIPLQSMISYLSETRKDGKRLTFLTNIMKTIGLGAPPILVTVIMLVTDRIRGEGGTSETGYYLINVLTVTAIGLLLSLPMLTRDRQSDRNASVERQSTVSLRQMIDVIRSNKYILIVFFINVLGFARDLSNVIMLQANGALVGKITLFGRTMDTTTSATWIPFVFGNVTSVIALFAVPAINKKLKEKKTYLLFSGAFFIFSVAAWLFYILQPEGSPFRSGNGAMHMLMVMSGIGSFLMGANEFIPLAMTADIASFEEQKTTQSNPSVPYAVLTMSIKIGVALGVILGLLLVGRSGYNQVVYETGAVTIKMQNSIMFAFMLIPGISALLSAVPVLFYDLNEPAETRREPIAAQ